MTGTEFLGNSISLESAMAAVGRLQPVTRKLNERLVPGRADIQARRFRGNAERLLSPIAASDLMLDSEAGNDP